MGLSLWGLNFFAFNESNQQSIHQAIFALAKEGLSPEYLTSVPVDIFYYYIRLYNKRSEDDKAYAQMQEARAGFKDKNAHPVGSNIPRKN